MRPAPKRAWRRSANASSRHRSAVRQRARGTERFGSPEANRDAFALFEIHPLWSRLPRKETVMTLTYRTATVDGLKVFYRTAGDPKHPAGLLLHGFPTSSHMFRDLIPALADRYHVVAPDLPGFGFSDAPDRKSFKYSFEHLAEVIERFTETIGFNRYAVYVFDYGAPLGFRLAIRHPDRIPAVISQNGNASLQGL